MRVFQLQIRNATQTDDNQFFRHFPTSFFDQKEKRNKGQKLHYPTKKGEKKSNLEFSHCAHGCRLNQ